MKYLDNFLKPNTTSNIKPRLGKSRTRSAITKPTFKNIFDAGKNGHTIKDTAMIIEYAYLKLLNAYYTIIYLKYKKPVV